MLYVNLRLSEHSISRHLDIFTWELLSSHTLTERLGRRVELLTSEPDSNPGVTEKQSNIYFTPWNPIQKLRVTNNRLVMTLLLDSHPEPLVPEFLERSTETHGPSICRDSDEGCEFKIVKKIVWWKG